MELESSSVFFVLCFEKECLEGTLFEQAEQSRRRRIVL
jgi:hypothetical protein